MKLLLTSILLCFTIHLLLAQSLTNNTWSCSHSNQDCHSDLSAYDKYKAIQQLNNQNLETQLLKRNNFTHKLDSAYTWGVRDGKEVIDFKAEYYYFPDKDEELILSFNKDFVNNTWVPNFYALQSFNEKGLMNKSSIVNWDGIYEFNHETPYSLSDYKYNSEGQITYIERSNLADILNNRITNKIFYQYDNSGKLINESSFFWKDNIDTMVHTREITNKYNENNQLVSIVTNIYDLQIGWKAYDSTILSYDTIGNNITEFVFIQNGVEPFNYRKFSESYYFYNEENQLKSKFFYGVYDIETDEFRSEEFYEFTYHDYGSLQQEIFFISTFYNPKEILSEEFYTHNKDLYDENTLRPRRWPLVNNNLHNEKYALLENEKYFVRDYGYRDLDFRTQSFYSEIDPVSTTNPVISDSNFLKVSPNPTSDFIYFDWTDYSGELDITLYNITGQKVRSQRSINNSAVDLTTLDSGVYFYTVGAGERVVSGRIVKM